MIAVTIIITLLLAVSTWAAPQYQQRPLDENPTPYDFQYKVDNPPTNTYFGQNENGDQLGRVAGSYYVYLPDGRLMTVDYTVDGDSGFVPRISFQNQGRPLVQG